jgi:hypothetical protein
MLARQLARTRPIRYAMDPLHRQAIDNYLALMTRGYGLPQLHRAAQPQIQAQLGNQADLFNEIIQGLLGGDEAAPAAGLDLYRDRHGSIPGEGDDLYMHGEEGQELPDLLNRLMGAHHALSGGLDVRGMFHPERVGRITNRRLQPHSSRAMASLLDVITSRGYQRSNKNIGDTTADYFDFGWDDRPAIPGLLAAFDEGTSALRTIPSQERGFGHAAHTRNASSNALRAALFHLTGQQPLEG